MRGSHQPESLECAPNLMNAPTHRQWHKGSRTCPCCNLELLPELLPTAHTWALKVRFFLFFLLFLQFQFSAALEGGLEREGSVLLNGTATRVPCSRDFPGGLLDTIRFSNATEETDPTSRLCEVKRTVNGPHSALGSIHGLQTAVGCSGGLTQQSTRALVTVEAIGISKRLSRHTQSMFLE